MRGKHSFFSRWLSWFSWLLPLSQVVTSAGDVAAQAFERRKGAAVAYDPERTAKLAGFGALWMGPSSVLWYRWLERFGGSVRGIVTKVAVNQSCKAPLTNGLFFLYAESLRRSDRPVLERYAERMGNEFLPTMLNSLLVWVPMQTVNFTFARRAGEARLVRSSFNMIPRSGESNYHHRHNHHSNSIIVIIIIIIRRAAAKRHALSLTRAHAAGPAALAPVLPQRHFYSMDRSFELSGTQTLRLRPLAREIRTNRRQLQVINILLALPLVTGIAKLNAAGPGP